jgi:hypothetical protein
MLLTLFTLLLTFNCTYSTDEAESEDLLAFVAYVESGEFLDDPSGSSILFDTKVCLQRNSLNFAWLYNFFPVLQQKFCVHFGTKTHHRIFEMCPKLA